MVSFIHSNAAVAAALVASLASTEAAYGRGCSGSRPSTALESRMLPTLRRSPFFSRGVQSVMRDFDEVFDAMLGEVDEMIYEPFSPLQRLTRPSYLLQGPSALNALAPLHRAKATYEITQDDKQLRIVVEAPGAKADDISLQLEEGGRLLRISGETKREEGGISVHSRFDQSFTLGQDVDTTKISAKIDNGVLTITAPKLEEAKKNVRKIDIVESKVEGDNGEKVEGKSDDVVDKKEEVDASLSREEEKSPNEKKPEVVDESVIDLDKE